MEVMHMTIAVCLSVEEFDLAKHLNTDPALVDRVYNRPTIETLQKETIKGATGPEVLKVCALISYFLI